MASDARTEDGWLTTAGRDKPAAEDAVSVRAVAGITVADVEQERRDARNLAGVVAAYASQEARFTELERERDEARAEVAALLVQLSEARDELDALRELADAAARRIETKPAPCDWCGGSGEILEIRPTTAMGMDGEIVRVPCPQCSPAGGGGGHDD